MPRLGASFISIRRPVPVSERNDLRIGIPAAMSIRLKSVTLKGYLTFRELDQFEPSQINILIGGNGAGKSNFISFFRMLSWMLGGKGQLSDFVGRRGGAGRLLHQGQQVTRDIEAELRLETDEGDNDYRFRLAYAAADTLIFTDEAYRFSAHGYPSRADWSSLGAGHREARLNEKAEEGDRTARTIRGLLRKCVVNQFHDTSDTSKIRGRWLRTDSRWLKEDAGNLGSFLLGLKESRQQMDNMAFRQIEETVRLLAPFFSEFVLEPDNGSVLLRWSERGSNMIFDASQAADGMLRAMALVSLLSQPGDRLPGVLLIDEPELGLHPYAINLIADLVKRVAQYSQVFIATQSAPFLDHFTPEDVVVVERINNESVLRRKSSEELQEWLGDYSLGELWRKNVLQGGP